MKLIELQNYNNYSVIVRQNDNGNPISITPFVVACGVRKDNNEIIDWAHGHYFDDLFNAVNFAKSRGKGTINYFRLEEIATKAINGLIESDEDSAYEYLVSEIEIDDHEAEFFEINIKKLDEWK